MNQTGTGSSGLRVGPSPRVGVEGQRKGEVGEGITSPHRQEVHQCEESRDRVGSGSRSQATRGSSERPTTP